MTNFHSKKTLKLTIPYDNEDEDTNSIDNNYIKMPEKIDYNRGNLIKDRLKSDNSSIYSLVNFYLTSPNKNYDFSYHWFEKCNNLNVIAEPIKINLDQPLIENNRDIACEFELLKLITEDTYHKENLIELPKSLKRLNRYPDVVPCNFFI